MSEPRARERPTYSAALLRAFAQELAADPELGPQLAYLVRSVGDRIPVEVAHQGLEIALSHTRDPDLGLRAARRLVRGTVGTVDYVVSSAATVGDAIEQASRYMRLINDILAVHLVVDGEEARVELRTDLIMPRAAVDFAVAGFFRNHVTEWLGSQLPELTVWFPHAAPADTTEYEQTFQPARLRFGMEATAFVFDRRFLSHPLSGADANLHGVLVPVAEETLSRLPATRSASAEVREQVTKAALDSGDLELTKVASRLGMSARTLARRLEKEGTTFRDIVDDERKRLALEWVGQRDLDLSAIGFRLGFSHGAAFHRAFRRWTGQTPLAYRRARAR
jgi:AraC-like DNA-binding protein